MTATSLVISHLGNPLARPEQLQTLSKSSGVPKDVLDAVRYHACSVIQAVGILLRLPQSTIAETIVLYCRFWLGSESPGLLDFDAKDVISASLFLVTKTGPYPLSPRQILNALYYVMHTPEEAHLSSAHKNIDQMPVYSEAVFEVDRANLIRAESLVMRLLGFQTHVALPHALCINYLQTLDVLSAQSGHSVTRRAYNHLNTALLSPQLLYLTHQPNELAVAAIYLAARECSVRLPSEQWWEVFDVDREELGFLVVALTSMPSFVEEHRLKYQEGPPPLTASALRKYLASADG